MRLGNAIILLLCLPCAAQGQYTNDWVQPGQTYVKINVAENGIYRLTYDDLANTGVAVSSIDPRLIQVIHRGVEQAILFNHDQLPADATFDPSEYLEFYGRRNDGTVDTRLYKSAADQPHTLYNLYSDTTAYFLTWNSSPVQGKRMEEFDQVNSTNIPAEVAQTSESLKIFATEYCDGASLLSTIYQSIFTAGEGWTGNSICAHCPTDFENFTFTQVANTVTSAGLPHVEAMIAGRAALSHQLEFYAGPDAGSLRLITTRTWEDFETTLISSDLDWSDVNVNGNVVFQVNALGVGGGLDRISVSYIKLSYPQDFDMTGSTEKTLQLSPNGGGKSYIEFTNSAPGTRLFDITDPSDVVVIGTRNPGVLSAVVPNTSTSRKLFVSSSFRSLLSSQLKAVTFRDLERDADFIIISHPSLTLSAGGYSNPVKEYASYRASAEGGGYDTLTVMIGELYDQFSYGEKSAVSIHEFMRMMVDVGDPQYLFLIGKGRETTQQYFRRTPLPGELPDLVPTGGSPASDAVFTIGLDVDVFVPAVPVGRLPATNSLQVATYLDKIKENEDAADYTWQKRVLHLSGGIQPNELTLYKSYVQGFEDIARQKYLGGDVVTFGKHSVSPVEFINIASEVNNGVNLVTFFGHSASNVTDIDIGMATDPVLGYDNMGKYPIVLVNGCYAGEFFSNSINFGVDWILAEDKGARNFMANSSFGIDAVLKIYTDEFYGSGFGDSILINKGIGDVQKAVAEKMLKDITVPSFNSAQVHQMVLLGDPSIKLLEVSSPDFVTSNESITVSAWDGKPVHALTDSLKVSVIVGNPGKGSGKQLRLRLIHTIDETISEFDALYPSPLNLDTINITLTRGNGNFFGSNKIEVIVDPLDEVVELNENNNVATWTKNITFNGTQNLQPAPFGIVGTASVDLVFMDTDLSAPPLTYELEVDTVPTFDSPFKISRSVDARVLGKSSLDLLAMDSLVYYWRTKPSGVADVLWETTSFSAIHSSGPGFAQLNFEQLSANAWQGLVSDPVLQTVEFEQNSVSFFVRTFGGDHPSSEVNGSFQVNNAEYYYSPQAFGCRDNTINLVAFDRSSVVPYLGIPFTFQNSFGRSCGREPIIINSFTATEVETGNGDDLIKYIDNIKEGDSVVLFSMGDAGFSLWSDIVVQRLGDFGILQADLDVLQDGEPVIILGKKGAPLGSATIIKSMTAPLTEQELQLTDSFTGRNPFGSIRSVTIGPSLKWKDVTPRFSGVGSSDQVSVDAIGIRKDGQEEILFANQTQGFSMDLVDATVYPYLKLKFNTADEVSLTPAMLDSWIVTFDPAPDGLVIPDNPQQPVSLQEGAVLNARFGFVNITTVPFTDLLQADLIVFNQEKRTNELQIMTIEGPAPGDTTFLQFDIATISKLGLNDITIKVNNGFITEQYLQNNTLELPAYLHVLRDNINPVLDVSIDGRYIINGDLVSANPRIEIVLLDENQLLGQLDTTDLALFLTYPCASSPCPATRVIFSGNEVVWTSEASGLKVSFNPKNLVDGEYELRVQGFDASGNPSGADPYIVSFFVESDPAVVYFPPYPNPSVGPFFFEFQAAGPVAPEGMVLQVLARDGREVARFDETAAEPLHVGLNQFQWTGLDAHGRMLSAGLYLFRLRVYQSGIEYTTSGRLMIAN